MNSNVTRLDYNSICLYYQRYRSIKYAVIRPKPFPLSRSFPSLSCSFQSHHGLLHQSSLELQQFFRHLLFLSGQHGFCSQTEERFCSRRAAPGLAAPHLHQCQWKRPPRWVEQQNIKLGLYMYIFTAHTHATSKMLGSLSCFKKSHQGCIKLIKNTVKL